MYVCVREKIIQKKISLFDFDLLISALFIIAKSSSDTLHVSELLLFNVPKTVAKQMLTYKCPLFPAVKQEFTEEAKKQLPNWFSA